ncbi:MAG: hypothetical protein SPK26_11890 [Treponema sp.]|nr:hypothetical protein [Treponema sp.]
MKIQVGGHPIIGFNMGARNSERVKETISTKTKKKPQNNLRPIN